MVRPLDHNHSSSNESGLAESECDELRIEYMRDDNNNNNMLKCANGLKFERQSSLGTISRSRNLVNSCTTQMTQVLLSFSIWRPMAA